MIYICKIKLISHSVILVNVVERVHTDIAYMRVVLVVSLLCICILVDIMYDIMYVCSFLH